MYLLATITLYVSAGSIINLLFEYTNMSFPDQLDGYYYYYGAGSTIRWPLALLIIVFPVFVWVARYLHKELLANTSRSEIRIRKWLLYFTLFLAALLVIGDLVALLYNFLGGEITTRFILKVFAVLAVGVGIFWYYLYDLRSGATGFSNRAKLFVWVAIVCVIAVVVGGFFTAGSPFRARLVRFDQQKVSDLSGIQGQIIYYWTNKRYLPNSLDALTDSISGYKAPMDPQSGASYGYETASTSTFKLCADFNLPAPNGPSGAYLYPQKINDSWDHQAGRVCFNRIIDPELYPKGYVPVQALPRPVTY